MKIKRRLVGLHPAHVVTADDPELCGRVLVTLTLDDGELEVWARVATLAAGHDRGTWMMPRVGDEVLVGFTAADIEQPFVVGALWNDVDRRPPVTASEASEVDRIRTVGGSVIEFDRSSGDERVIISTKTGQRVELDATSNTVTITDGAATEVTVGPSGVEIAAPTVDITASLVRVEAASATFSGVVQADTIVATNVVGTNYTPGAGNVL